MCDGGTEGTNLTGQLQARGPPEGSPVESAAAGRSTMVVSTRSDVCWHVLNGGNISEGK